MQTVLSKLPDVKSISWILEESDYLAIPHQNKHTFVVSGMPFSFSFMTKYEPFLGSSLDRFLLAVAFMPKSVAESSMI